MLIYVIAIAIIFLILLYTNKREQLKNTGLFISFVILWMIASFRDAKVGLDTGAYVDYFTSVHNGLIDDVSSIDFLSIFSVNGFENGYKIYNYLISILTGDYTLFFVITYGFIFYSFYYFIKKYSTNTLLSMVMFITIFFFSSMNQMRQALAMAILTWGLKYIIQRRFVPYLLVVLLATLIHQASIIMIIPYFLYKKEVSNKTVIVYGAITVILFLISDIIVNFLASSNMRYEVYTEKINSFELGSILNFALILFITLFLAYLFRKNKKSMKEIEIKQQSFYLKMMILSMFLSLIAIRISALNRFTLFFLLFSLLSVPFFISNSPKKLIMSYSLILILVLVVYRALTLILKPEWLGVSNYIFASIL